MNDQQFTPPTNAVSIFDLVQMRVALTDIDSEAIAITLGILDAHILNFANGLTLTKGN